MKEELNILIQAQYPLIYLVTSEEERAEQAIYSIAQSSKPQRRLYVWTVTHAKTSASGSAAIPATPRIC